MDGVDAIAAGSSFFPSVKFVVLTIFDDEDKDIQSSRPVGLRVPAEG